MKKNVSIKAYTAAGAFIREIYDAEFSGFTKSINQGLGSCQITVARKFDDIGTDFIEGNFIEIWVADKETVLMANGPLRARRIYTGQVTQAIPSIDSSGERIQITCAGVGTLLALDVLKSSSQTTLYTRTSGNIVGTSPPQSIDISSAVQGIIDRYRAETVNPRISYTALTVPSVGTNMTYTFEQRTYKEALEKCLSAAPYGFYWYVDEDGQFYFKKIETTPTHKFIFGKHFSDVRVERSLEKTRNVIVIWNGLASGSGGIYKNYSSGDSVQRYGRRIERLTDSGIGDSGTMDAMAAKFLAENAGIEVKFVCTIIDNQGDDNFGYDIESIRPGDTCTFFNFNSSISALIKENMMITEIDYSLDKARITIEPVRMGLSDITERLKKQISEETARGMMITYT